MLQAEDRGGESIEEDENDHIFFRSLNLMARRREHSQRASTNGMPNIY